MKYDITAWQGESKLEFILSKYNEQQYDGTLGFYDANLLNLDLSDRITLIKDAIKHFRFSHHLRIVYKWCNLEPDRTSTLIDEIGVIEKMNITIGSYE